MLKLALACIGGGVVYLFLRQATIRQRRQVAVAWSNEPTKRIPVKGDPFSRTQEANRCMGKGGERVLCERKRYVLRLVLP